jgi:hypothetical protein
MVKSPVGLGNKNHSAGEALQQFTGVECKVLGFVTKQQAR